MKTRLAHHNPLPLFFNLGLQRQKKPLLVRWENSSYLRENETLENPIRKSLQLAEFVTLFGGLLSSGAKIGVINNDDKQVFSYEH
jgi:hypothetical protein